MPDVSDIRRRVRRVITHAREEAQRRRERVDVASAEGQRALAQVVGPVAQQLAGVLRAERRAFRVETPAGAVRLLAEGSADRYVEVVLDTEHDPPALLIRTSRPRGSRVLVDEHVLRASPELATLTEDDALDPLIEAVGAVLD